MNVSVQTMTADQVRQAGFQAVYQKLGAVGLIRFWQQFERGHGNYSVERHEWFARYTVDELVAEAEERQKQRQ